ncbi:MAG TPA: glycoside hydrolase family 97 N-terminal domain-containing protein [Roseimicrobium sp.]|nr:glycoside hydrolase family 97 N-terminal domain-containing protein [Roseimicrobium sp.]
MPLYDGSFFTLWLVPVTSVIATEVKSPDGKLVVQSKSVTVTDCYELPTSKRRLNTYEAKHRAYSLVTAEGRRKDVVFQVSNDGVAFRYGFPERSAGWAPNKYAIGTS